MIIPITVQNSPSSNSSTSNHNWDHANLQDTPDGWENQKLPPGLAKISNDEIILIELQGSLEVDYNHPRERDGQFVGKLRIDEAATKPTLQIGHHLLEGKIVSLPKPLAVLLRNPRRPTIPSSSSSVVPLKEDGLETTEDEDTSQPQGDDGDASLMAGGGSSTPPSPVGWTIKAIVKRKIVFSKRPTPIVGPFSTAKSS